MLQTRTTVAGDATAQALRDTLISPNESDSNMEAANVVDGLFAIARAIGYLADAIRLRSEHDEGDDE